MGQDLLGELTAIQRGEAPPSPVFDPEQEAFFAGFSGFELRATVQLLPGVMMRPIFADMFSAPMLAFAPPPVPRAPHPGPWVGLQGSFSFQVRTELAMSVTASCGPLTRLEALWMFAAVFRLYVPQPLRAVFVANKPIDEMGLTWGNSVARSFEVHPTQIGAFRPNIEVLKEEDVRALGHAARACSKLWPNERFRTALTLFDQVSWSVTIGAGTLLVWTAIEALYAIPRGLNTGHRLADAIASHITDTRSDRDRWFPRVRDAYRRRGTFAHAGHAAPRDNDFIEAVLIARKSLHRVIEAGSLPTA